MDAVARLSLALLLSFEGSKCLYQGEEIGQTETELERSEIVDPPGLKFWPEYKGRDGCRTPMVWEADAPEAGFTTGTPWLPVKAPQAARAVDRQDGVAGSVLEFYRTLLAHYRETEAFWALGTEFLDAPAPVLAFRKGGVDGLTCVFNLGAGPVTYEAASRGALDRHSNAELATDGTLSLPGYGWAWLLGEA